MATGLCAGSGMLRVLAGVGQLPIIQTAAIALLEAFPASPMQPVTAAWSLATVLAHACLLQYEPSALDMRAPLPGTIHQELQTYLAEAAVTGMRRGYQALLGNACVPGLASWR